MKEFKVGDKCVVEYTVTEIVEEDVYPINCRNENGKSRTFTRDGVVYLNGKNVPILKHIEDITPKPEFPKWMMVSQDSITDENKGNKRFVVYRDETGYISIFNGNTKCSHGCCSWGYAKEIEPENNKLQELEEKYKELGQEIEKLKNKQ